MCEMHDPIRYYVVEYPKTKAATVVAVRYSFEEALNYANSIHQDATVMDTAMLSHNIVNNDFEVKWWDSIEKPKAVRKAEEEA